MNKILKQTIYLLIFGILILITQIGGVIFLLSIFLSKRIKKVIKLQGTMIFITLYLFSTFLIVPFIAPFWGREAVQHNAKIKPVTFMTVLLNRNYVKPKLNQLLQQVAKELKGTDIEIHYLDASFPFINKFPLLPHFSHNDGKKLDISLIYETPNGIITNKQKSNSGYGVFEAPKLYEQNQIERCFKKGYFQYDYPKYLTFGTINNELVFSTKGTKKLINTVLNNNSLGKLFIEPHLKDRMNLHHRKIRYHGCRSVRHDDHIHIQLK